MLHLRPLQGKGLISQWLKKNCKRSGSVLLSDEEVRAIAAFRLSWRKTSATGSSYGRERAPGWRRAGQGSGTTEMRALHPLMSDIEKSMPGAGDLL
jgi:hypothetical protein